VAKPGELLFEFVRASDRAPMSCELRFHGESFGWECQCLYDGDLVYGQLKRRSAKTPEEFHFVPAHKRSHSEEAFPIS
jgi:hypothetical protein